MRRRPALTRNVSHRSAPYFYVKLRCTTLYCGVLRCTTLFSYAIFLTSAAGDFSLPLLVTQKKFSVVLVKKSEVSEIVFQILDTTISRTMHQIPSEL